MSVSTEIPVQDLMQKYDLSSRISLYNRLKALEIPRRSNSKGVTVDSQFLPLLDALHMRLANGDSMAKAAEHVKREYNWNPIDGDSEEDTDDLPEQEPAVNGALSRRQPDQSSLVIIDFLEELASRTIAPPVSPVVQMRELEEAAEKGWIFTTDHIQQLIGMRPRGDAFEWGAFLFKRTGRMGRQNGWIVVRV